MKIFNYLLFIAFVFSVSCRQSANKEGPCDFYAPASVSEEAQEVIKSFKKQPKDMMPAANDLDKWKLFWEYNEKSWTPFNDTLLKVFKPVLKDTTIGGVSCIDVRPKDWTNNGKILIYNHGGAYTLFSARTMLMGAVPVAQRTGLRVISVSYTNPPFAKWNQILDQVISVVKALLQQGYTLADIGIYGDSAGGGLTAGVVLKMRDLGLGMPAAVVLISPWSDISEVGDTYITLKEADPILNYEKSLGPSSLAYASKEEHKNPYVSPVYADYSKGFPPTLIQGGTKEIFLSNFVRQYQAMDQAGIEVKLDLYEGMWHVFQEINYDLPESKTAHKKMSDFFKMHLGY